MTKQKEAAVVGLQYSFSKSKIPRSFSYPLKRSLLDAGLVRSSISRIFHVFYNMRHGGNIVMRADFMGEGHGFPPFSAGKSSLTVYAVPSQEKHAIETLLLMEACRAFVRGCNVWSRKAMDGALGTTPSYWNSRLVH